MKSALSIPAGSHLSPADRHVWQSLAHHYFGPWEQFEWDVQLGQFRSPEFGGPPENRPGLEALCAVRVDVLRRTPGLVQVVELKAALSWGAIGQALGYTTLLPPQPVGVQLGRPIVMCLIVPPDLLFAAQSLDIIVLSEPKP